jgi:5-methylcytosine-specific restriction endonuclease McrA
MPAKRRNYKAEYERYHSRPEQIRRRAQRNAARRILGLKKGDGKEVDHKKPLSKGGTNSRDNLSVKTRSSNRKKYNK